MMVIGSSHIRDLHGFGCAHGSPVVDQQSDISQSVRVRSCIVIAPSSLAPTSPSDSYHLRYTTTSRPSLSTTPLRSRLLSADQTSPADYPRMQAQLRSISLQPLSANVDHSLSCASNSMPTSNAPPKSRAFFPPLVATYRLSAQSTLKPRPSTLSIAASRRCPSRTRAVMTDCRMAVWIDRE